MSANGNGRIHLLDHQKPQSTKAEREKAEVAFIEARVREISREVAEHYMAQVPGLVATMLGEMLHANGMTLKAPAHWKSIPAVAPMQELQSGDAAVPGTTEHPSTETETESHGDKEA